MPEKVDWNNRIGRRLRLRDLHVLALVVEAGSMAKAAQRLGISQPAISEVIANLENAVEVRLLDRLPHGVLPTVYGAALLNRSSIAFDELRQGIRDIEFLSDPSVGRLEIGCPEAISIGILQPILRRYRSLYPAVAIDIGTISTFSLYQQLKGRTLDVGLALGALPLDDPVLAGELDIETIVDDELVVAVSKNSKWARRRKLDIAELGAESWILADEGTWNYRVVANAFAARGIPMPRIVMRTLSIHIRASMVSTSDLVTTFPTALEQCAQRYSLTALPVRLGTRTWPVVMATLKHRTLSPVVERFMECARKVGQQSSSVVRRNPPKP